MNATYIDTCLVDELTDHCHGNNEWLISVPVSASSDLDEAMGEVIDALLCELTYSQHDVPGTAMQIEQALKFALDHLSIADLSGQDDYDDDRRVWVKFNW